MLLLRLCHCRGATAIAMVLRHCCFVALLLCGAVVMMALVLRGTIAAMALLSRGVTAAAWRYCNDGVVAAWCCCCMVLLLERWRYNAATEIFFCFFFYSITSREKMKARKRKMSEIRNLFPSSIG